MKRVIFATPWSEIPCQLRNVFQDAKDNLTDIKDDENKTEILPHNIQVLLETVDSEKSLDFNTMIYSGRSSECSTKRLEQLNKMPQERYKTEQKKKLNYMMPDKGNKQQLKLNQLSFLSLFKTLKIYSNHFWILITSMMLSHCLIYLCGQMQRIQNN